MTIPLPEHINGAVMLMHDEADCGLALHESLVRYLLRLASHQPIDPTAELRVAVRDGSLWLYGPSARHHVVSDVNPEAAEALARLKTAAVVVIDDVPTEVAYFTAKVGELEAA
jgi:hypothetical protein